VGDAVLYEALSDGPAAVTIRGVLWRKQSLLPHFVRWWRWVASALNPQRPSALVPPSNCGRKWLPLCTSPPTSTSARPFTVVTYNLLATAHIGDARIKAEYSHLPDNMKFVAREEYRVPRLAAELGSYGATVLCLQEVDAVDFNGKRPLPVMLGDATGFRYDWKFHARALPPNCRQEVSRSYGTPPVPASSVPRRSSSISTRSPPTTMTRPTTGRSWRS